MTSGEKARLRLLLARCAYESAASTLRLYVRSGHGGAPVPTANAREALRRADVQLTRAINRFERLE